MNVRSRICRSHLYVAALLIAGAIVQGLILTAAELPAADAARFAAVAQAIEREGVWATWRDEPDPIGFPLWAVVVRRVLRYVGLVDPRDWASPLQVAAALPLVPLPALVFLLLRRLVGEEGGLAGAAFFSVATDVARLGAAGIADSLLLTLQVLALLALAEHLACGRRWWLLGAGVLCGGAILVKGTSILLPASMFGGLVWEAARRVQGSMVQLGRGAMLAAGCLAVLVPAAVASGASTPRAVMQRLFLARVEEPVLPLNAPGGARRGPAPAWQEHWRLANGEWMTFGKKDPRESIRFFGWVPAGWELFRELMQGLLPWGLILAARGAWAVRGRMQRPIDRMALAVCGVWCLGVWFYAARTGYLSTRHVLPVVVLGCGWCGLGVLLTGRTVWRCWRGGSLGVLARVGGSGKPLKRNGNGRVLAGSGTTSFSRSGRMSVSRSGRVTASASGLVLVSGCVPVLVSGRGPRLVSGRGPLGASSGTVLASSSPVLASGSGGMLAGSGRVLGGSGPVLGVSGPMLGGREHASACRGRASLGIGRVWAAIACVWVRIACVWVGLALVWAGITWVWAGIAWVWGRIAWLWGGRGRPAACGERVWARRGRLAGRTACVAMVGAAAIAAALPRTLAPFHAYRAAHRQAGLWLAEAAGKGSVLDTHAWTGLYSGRPTWRFDQAERALVDPSTMWLVVEEPELTGSGRRARTLRRLAETGVLAASFVSGTGSRQVRVAVYRWNPMVLAGGGGRHAR